MAPDDLVTQGAKASAAKIFSHFSWYIRVSTSKVKCIYGVHDGYCNMRAPILLVIYAYTH